MGSDILIFDIHYKNNDYLTFSFCYVFCCYSPVENIRHLCLFDLCGLWCNSNMFVQCKTLYDDPFV